MAARKACFIHSPALERYSYPPDCPFSSARAGMARAIVSSMGLLAGDGREEVAPGPATPEQLSRFHAPGYLEVLRRAQDGALDVAGLNAGLGTPDCPVFKGMYDYAALACGATLAGADLIRDGKARAAFNPSGGYHHAHTARAAGFCYLNDVVLGCMRLADAGMKVMFVDVDAHHADGVQEAFYARRDVMTVSMHQDGRTLFPGTGSASELGAGDGLGLSVNLPMPAGTSDEPFLWAFRETVPPLLGAFAPDAVVLELGMDGLAGDPLANLCLTNNAHAEVVGTLVASGRPLLVTGGGGYNPQATARGWALAWSILCGDHAEHDPSLGMGGVMLQSTEWQGGLRDRVRADAGQQREEVARAVRATVDEVKRTVFPLHKL